jgi:glutamate/tyrosine decarboxylase-like PLP-dependent enzyme
MLVDVTRPEPTIWGDETTTVEALLDWVRDRVVRASDPKTTAQPASTLRDRAGATITPSGIGGDAAMRVFTEVLAPATRAQDDPLNLSYIPAAPTRSAVAFDAVTSAANIFGGYWEAGAGAIFAENEALAWLISLLGWPSTAEGVFVSGGTAGNLSALHAARHAALTARGSRPTGGWKVALTSDAHSSNVTAARVLDVDVVFVPTDDSNRLRGAALREVLHENPEVFAVIASAGSTNLGAVDALDEVADACADFGTWLHVDGAYGGATLASPTYRHLLAGVERADSFIVDPHKWLFAPYDSCALIYRDGALARAAHAQHAVYLDAVDHDAPNPSELAIHLSRRVRGLPFWFSLATHGTDRYAAAIDKTIDTAHEVARRIDASEHLELVVAPELSILLFRRIGWDAQDYAAWSRKAAVDGVILCVPTKYRGETLLRLAFVNPATDADAVMEALDSTR